MLETLDPKELLRTLLEEFNIENYYKNNPVEQDRYDNIQELKASVDKFSDQVGGNLRDFLQEISCLQILMNGMIKIILLH